MNRPSLSTTTCATAFLTFLAVSALGAAAPTTQPSSLVSDPDLVACWRGDSVQHNVALDASGHHHDAKTAGNDSLTTEAIAGRTAFRFNKGAGSLNAGAASEYNFTADFTIAFFARLADVSGDMSLIQKLGKEDGYAIESNVSSNWGIVFTGSPRGIPTTSRPLRNDWFHVAVTYHSNQYLVYVDGRSIGVLMNQPMPPPNKLDLTFGAAEPNGAGAMDGWMDDIRIYHRALKIDEIRQIKDGKPLTNPYSAMTSQEQERIRDLARSLGAAAFEEREDAQRKLKTMGRKIFPVLREFRADADAEVSLRTRDLLGELPALPDTTPTVPQPAGQQLDLSDIILPIPN